MDPFVLIGKILGDLFGESLRQLHEDLTKRKQIKDIKTGKVIEMNKEENPLYCPRCDKRLFGEKYCPNCGTRLKPNTNIDER